MTSALKRSVLATAVATLVAAPAYATNGMNMDSFGAKAGGMGGASFAYDSGNSAVMNNPATLALRKEGNNFGLGLTVLMPDVNANNFMGDPSADYSSGGDSYLMPSVSFIRKQGQFAYGFGVVAQGGMGTEYGVGDLMAPVEQRSELGFMRVMFPLAYQVNDALSVAGQIDYVRGTLDIQQVADMSGDGMPDAYIDVSDDSDFNGEMSGDGWAFKLGAHYKINNAWSIGATYHSKTNIDDMTGSGTISDFMGNTAYAGEFRVKDFQWPETYGVGVAWNVSDKLMLAADIKRLKWSESMKDFTFGPKGMEMTAPQDWDDQTVYMIGAQYMITPTVALRAGFNYAENPVPDSTLNYLFPAIVEQHYTLGVGWNIGGGHTLAASVAYAPEVEQDSTLMPVTMTHSQTTWRVNYNYNF
ncbi:MAG: OmpP1/FadL family transporter [Pseudomonadota bacterium]